MNAQAIRRPTAAKGRGRGKASSRKAPARAASPWPEGSGRLARYAFLALVAVMVIVALIALDLPAKALRATGAATGEAGFKVASYQIEGLRNMDRRKVDAVVTDELRRAAEEAPVGIDEPAQALVDLDLIRENLLQFGWVKDARVSRRLPDGLVVDIIERTPAAVWQQQGRLSLIDGDGVVLDAVRVDRMPDLPLLIGPGANRQAVQLKRMIDSVPTLKPQLASATWIGGRRWDLTFATGENVSLPEGEAAAAKALQRFAKMDRSVGLLGRDMIRFDLRVPGKMIVRVPPGATPPPAGLTPEATN
ncbi:cell division protein FtsQ/DivIB [Sphingomonas sp. LHG3406-1]|uniref:cell division protein FtsQ/DivIB n=1 Tax=Sphingomonas sp. LHG3406-1 TaxID=2804617 RepID=UPI002612637A|nr:cell division protein FtsQ/DivIB [Sphingomonas sp. LHG3406-1]